VKTATVPSAFIPRMHVLVGHLNTISWPALAVSITWLAIIILLPRITERVPGSIVAMLACTIFVALLGLAIETIGTKFGGIPTGFSKLSLPDFKAENILPLFPPAATVALLAAVESLLSAVVADSWLERSTIRMLNC
jgi:SulP family sulfate permease